MSKSKQLQKRVLAKIRDIEGDENFAKKLSKELFLSVSAIYKRIRLERILSVEELIILTNRYNLSMDELIKD